MVSEEKGKKTQAPESVAMRVLYVYRSVPRCMNRVGKMGVAFFYQSIDLFIYLTASHDNNLPVYTHFYIYTRPPPRTDRLRFLRFLNNIILIYKNSVWLYNISYYICLVRGQILDLNLHRYDLWILNIQVSFMVLY